MKDFSTILQTRKAALSTAACYAIEILATPALRYCNWDQDLTIGGDTYLANMPIQKPSISGSSCSIALGNTDDSFTALALAGDLKRKAVTVYEVFPPVGSDSDPAEGEILFKGEIDGGPGVDLEWCSIPLGPLTDQTVALTPRRRIVPACRLVFKGADCGYSGATTTCPKTKAGCLSGFYGGFSFVPAPGTAFVWGSEKIVVK